MSAGEVGLEREGSPPAVLNHNEDVIGTLGDIMEIELLKQPEVAMENMRSAPSAVTSRQA